MGDMTPTIIAKSDQLNAADLAGGPITVTVTKVDVRDAKEQPVSVHYQGDNGKPWKPCKSMCRVMVAAWGPDSKVYPGKRLTLFCDPSVKWAGMEIGGIRISHMSDIDGPLLTAVTLAKGSRKPYRVEPLASDGQRDDNGAREVADDLIRRIDAAPDGEALAALAEVPGIIKRREWLRDTDPALYDKVGEAFEARERALSDTTAPDNPTAQEGRDDSDMGDGFDGSGDAVAAHLAAIRNAQTVIDLNGIIDRFANDMKGLPDDVFEMVQDAEADVRRSLVNPLAGG